MDSQIATARCTIQIWKLSLSHQESYLNEQNEAHHLQQALTEGTWLKCSRWQCWNVINWYKKCTFMKCHWILTNTSWWASQKAYILKFSSLLRSMTYFHSNYINLMMLVAQWHYSEATWFFGWFCWLEVRTVSGVHNNT